MGFGNCSGDVRASSRNKLPSLTEQLGAKCLHWYDEGMAGIPAAVVDEEENERHQKKAELS